MNCYTIVCIKQFIAVDGTSLTIFDIDEASITISLIPHTVSESVIGEKMPEIS